MISEKHPVYFILKLVNDGVIKKGSQLSFSVHKYSFKENIDERIIFKIDCKSISLEWLKNQIADLDEGWELSMNSAIISKNNKVYHLPMIDFNFEILSTELEEILEYRIGKKSNLLKYKDNLYSMAIFSSGRSFHGYGKSLLSVDEWVEFTTAILLLNYTYNVDKYSIIVDNRWVAHRLLAKYSCLRWSNQTSQFKKYPELEREFFIYAPNKAVTPIG